MAVARERAGVKRAMLVVAAYIGTALVMTWPYVNYADFAAASYGGDQRLIIWTLAWDNHALLTGDSLFDSNLFFPAADSLRYNEHLFGLSLFTLPWALAGASPVLAHNATWWLAFPLNGVATFAFLRRFTSSALAAFFGSLVFTYSFYVMSHAHGALHLIWLWPIPLSLLLLERWLEAPSARRAALWATVLLAGILTSWYMAVFVLMANALFGLILVCANRHGMADGWGRRTAHVVLALVVIGACVYPFARHYVDLEATSGELGSNSADLASYLVPPENTIAGRWWRANVDSRPRAIWGEQTLFAGWLALAGAAAGTLLLVRGGMTRAWLFPLLTLVAGLLSFGPALPLLGETALAPFPWLAGLPGLDGIRAPARFAVVALLGLAGLNALAASALIRRYGTTGRLVVAALVPFLLLEWFVVAFPAGKPQPLGIPAIYRTPEVQSARSLVSLPEYWGTTDWVLGGDYLYYSTAHWRPIVNGFGRSAPPGYDAVASLARAFPASAGELRDLGVQYAVVHVDRFPDGGRDILATAARRPGVRLVRRIGNDVLFELVAPSP